MWAEAPRGGAGPDPARGPVRGFWLASLRALARLLLRIPRALVWVLPVAWMGLIWRLSSRSFEPAEPSFAFSVLSNLVHAPLFGLLALFWAALLAERPPGERSPLAAVGPGRAAVALALVVLYGIADEWHQSRVPGRDASALDVVTDAVAAAATLLVVLHVVRAGATERGLVARLLAGLAACVAVATWGAAG